MNRLLRVVLGFIGLGIVIYAGRSLLISREASELEAPTEPCPLPEPPPDEPAQIKAVMCGLGDVLIKSSSYKLVRSIGLGDVMWYTSTGGHTTDDLKNMMFSFIDYMAEVENKEKRSSSKRTPTIKGHPMSPAMILWKKGKLSSVAMLEIALLHVEDMDRNGVFESEVEKRIATNMAKALLDPETQAKSKDEILDSTKIIRMLASQKDKSGKRKYIFILVSNTETELIPLLTQRFPNIFNIFDDVIMSGDIGMMKPDEDIYDYILEKYNLKPSECVFLDSAQENIEAAEDIGIHSIKIQKGCYKQVRTGLADLGMLPASK
ncbi:HAD-IA family hydrolase [Candidatus Babeliales bacterium]|nr:HAD-IA family hydrolase [Candidatus Babeliales bacterium]